MLCESCGKDHVGSYGSGRFCGVKCSRGFSTKANRLEINKKVSLALKKPPKIRQCKCAYCQNMFEVIGRSKKICSESCRLASIKRASILGAKTKTLNGTHSGWHTRKGEMSYPEKYFKSIFDFAKLSYAQEHKIGKWFIDFAFLNKKIAVEIDGRQHEDAERKSSDESKDSFLVSQGWQVLRVRWFNPINQKNKDLLYPQIDKVLNSVRC